MYKGLAAALALAIFATLAGSAAGQGSDNCCGTDGRVCSTDAEWDRGYYDRQAGLCGAPAVASVAAGGSSSESSAAAGDTTWIFEQNCCHRSGTCGSEEDWDRGYYDFHAGRCGAVPAELAYVAIPEHERRRSAAGQSDIEGGIGYFGGPTATDHEGNQLVRVYNPTTGTTTFFKDQDGNPQLTIRRPTDEEFCAEIRRQELPPPPKCE